MEIKNKLKLIRILNTCFILMLLIFPSIGFTQVLEEVINELKRVKSKNYNFYLDERFKKNYGTHQLEVEGTKTKIYGKVQTVLFRNLKGNKVLSDEDKQYLLDKVKSILKRNEYSFFSKTSEGNTYIFQKIISDINTNYFEFIIPNNSDEYCELIFTKGTTEINYLNDRSFEDYRNTVTDNSWEDCAKNIFNGNSPPGVHYSDFYDYGFAHPASDGKKYISLIARDDKTWELIGQKLNYALEKDSCYNFSVDLRNEDKFKSITRSNKREMQFYDTKLVLTISLSKDLCYPSQKIYRSEAIWNTDWKKYEIEFAPKDDYNFIIFEVNYADSQAGNGNIMMDNISDIKKKLCKN